MEQAFMHGHKMRYNYDTECWYYVDTGEILHPHAKPTRPCPKCGLRPTEEGHDGCLGTLPGVRWACCGHGVEGAYLVWNDGWAYYWDANGDCIEARNIDTGVVIFDKRMEQHLKQILRRLSN
jgi:hypothetical protein